MNKRFLVLAVASILIITIVSALSFFRFLSRTEDIGGKYNASVTYWNDHSELSYTDESGLHTSSYFDDELSDGLNWIKTSIPETATFLCWWNYGHIIKAVGERDVIVRNPSHEILNSIADPTRINEFAQMNK